MNIKSLLKPVLAACVFALGMAGPTPWRVLPGQAQTPPPAAAAPAPDSVSLPPKATVVTPDASLPEPVKVLERDTLQYLTDGNTQTSYTAYARSTIRLTLNTGREVKGLKVFGASPYLLSVKSVANGQLTAVAGLDAVDLSTLGPGWNHIAATQPLLANQLELTVTPLQQGGGSGIAEVELWGKGTHINATAQNVTVAEPPPQAVTVRAADVAADAEFLIGSGEGAAVSARFNFTSPLAPNQMSQAFLVYELNGLTHWSEASRSINGAPAKGGYVRREAGQWSTQSEQVAPDLIAAGENFIEFRAIGDGSVPYSIRNVRLVIDPDNGWNFIDHIATNQGTADNLIDGDAASGWQVYPSNVGLRAAEPTLVAELRQAVTIDRVRLNLSEPLSGNLAIEVRTGTEWQAAQGTISAGTLVPGFNDIVLATRPTGTAVRLRFAGGDGAAKVAELQVAGSPAGAPDANPGLSISYPDAGQYFGDMAYVRGFLRPYTNSSGPARIVVAGKPANVDRGSFEISVAKSELNVAADGAWSVNVDAVYPDGRVVTREVKFDQLIDALRNDSATAVSLTTDVAANAAKLISLSDAQLDIATDALGQTTRILAQTLDVVDLARLDAGMVNITKGPRHGYRFLPHGTRFKKKVKLTVPYDKAKLPVGFTEDQIRTFFFDTDRGAWVPLERVEINTAKGEIVSLTDHFTDFVNGVVAVPDHPETSSLNPTQFKDMKAANPGAKINVIAPPETNASGDMRLSYPLELPPGRTGHAPSLGLSYSSSGENGWVGLGWDLSVSSVTAETRWGVPRYDAAKETETYNLDSEQLTPVAHRGELIDRAADKQFFSRSESQFRRIIRHGDHPNAYWWEVREKDGTAFFYGGAPEGGSDATVTLKDGSGNIFKWALKEVRDTNGNSIRYTYATVSDPGMAGGTVAGTALYPQGIDYTGHAGSPGAYTVTFIRDRELPDFQRRKDVTIDARGGFKMVTADLLRRIEVKFGAELVRTYELTYREGAFHKTLLDKIQQLDSAGQPFNEHLLTYYDDARETNGAYKGFAGTTTWNTGSDNVEGDALIGGGLDASALSGLEGSSAGGHLFVGIAFGGPSKGNSVGAKVGANSGDIEGLLALVDLDGDGLQDKVFRRGGGISYRPNRAGPGGTTTFGSVASVGTLPNISVENNSMSSFGPEVYLGVFFVGANTSSTDTESPIYFRDVNGDGLVDLVRNGRVLFNRIVAGLPTFDEDSSDTPYPIGDASVTAGLLTAEMQAIAARQDAANPKIDTLRRWVAPYSGTIGITAPVALLEDTSPQRADYLTADGVRVAIQVNATELWSETIAATDYAVKAPTGVGAIAVQKGDIVYFRVQAVDDGAYDRVSWAPQIAYQGSSATDSNGLSATSFDATADFTLNSLAGAQIRMPFNGTVQVTGTLEVSAPVSDSLTVQLLKNGAVIAAPSLSAGATGNIVLNESVAVLKDEFDANGNPTQTGDTLEVRIVADSRIDMANVTWAAATPPRIAYTASSEITPITDPQTGGPAVALNLPAGADLYSVSDLTQPLAPFIAAAPSTTTFQADVTAAGTGPIVVTAKSGGALLAKQVIAGSGSATLSVTTTAANQPIFFEFHTRDAALGAAVTQHQVRLVTGGIPGGPDLPSALYFNEPGSILPQSYRGWVAFGYKGNGAAAGQPVVITGADLTLSGLTGLDPAAYRAAVEQIIANGGDPSSLGQQFDLKVVPYYPNHPLARVDGPDPELWASATDLSTSRRGKNFIDTGAVDRFAGARAVPLLSMSEEFAIAGGVSIASASKADTVSRALLDFKDLNGDQFPDIVSNGLAVQFSPMIGGLETGSRGVGATGAAQQTAGEAFTFGIGGNFAHISANASSGIDVRFGLSGSGDTSQQMASIGFSASLSEGESDVDYDLYDVNGDGLPDRVSKSGALTVQLNIGYGFLGAEPWSSGSINKGESNATSLGGGFNDGIYGFGGGINQSEHKSDSLESLQDVNGDGLVDRVLQGGDRSLTVGINTGNGFFANAAWPSGLGSDFAKQRQETQGAGAYFTISIPIPGTLNYIIINPGADFSRTLGRGEASIADIDGDGYPDHLKSTDDSALTVSGNTHGRTNMLRSVTRPLMASFEVDYVRTGNTYAQPQNRWALARLEVNDGQPGDGEDRLLKTFAWEGGLFERRERQFFGFAKCIETQLDPANPTVAYRVVERLYNNTTFYNKMLLAKETLSDGTGNPFTQVEHTYVVRDEATQLPLVNPADLTARAFAQLARTDKRWFEGQATAGKQTFETFAYDTFGNVSQYIDTSEAGPADDVTADITYHQDLTTYVVGKAASIRVSGNGVLMRERQATFAPGTGNLLQVRRLLAGGTAAVTDLTYDSFGNLATLTGPANHAGQRYGLTYAYEPIANTHVASVTDSFGYVSTAEYDLKWGSQTQSTDINAKVITTVYDTVGRPLTVTGPYQQGTSFATIAMEYHPYVDAALTFDANFKPWARTRHLDQDRNVADFIETVTFIDGLTRVTQTKKDLALNAPGTNTASDVMVVSGRAIYDGFGRVVEQRYPVTEAIGTGPVFNATVDPVPPTLTTYDILDRPLSVKNPANETTAFLYNFGPDRAGVQQFRTRVTDAKAIARELFRDVDDDITSVKLLNNGGGQTLWTSYGYDPLDQIVAVTDAKNNVTRAKYDNFGRRTEIDSPDAGRTEFVFDLAGNLHQKITANLRAAGSRITYNYDFNRIATAVYPQFPANNATYTYGAPGAALNRAGRAFRIQAESGVREMDFGPLGEVVKEVRTVDSFTGPDPTYTTLYRYDTWNRLQALTYPDGEVLDYDYDSGGLVTKIAGAKSNDTYAYLNFLGYDKFEARTRVAYGNGTVNDYAYNANHRRLADLKAKTATNRTFMDMDYGYDPVGNILSLANVAPMPPSPSISGGQTAYTFGYDDLHQLTTSVGTYVTLPNKTEKFTLSLAYDEIHNITSKDQLAGSLKSNGTIQEDKKITYDWAYDYGSAKPHAATHIGDRTFLYDLNGNQAGWDADRTGQKRRIVWDEENRIQTITDGPTSEYKYDEDTNRVIKRRPQGETFYVNQFYVDNAGRNSKHVFAGTTRISTKLEMPGGNGGGGPGNFEKFLYFYHPDHLGSTSYVTDELGEVDQHYETFPFGESWIEEATGQADKVTPYRFTGKEWDSEVQLYYFGARYYDPRTSLWAAMDPALEKYLSGSNTGGVFEPKNLALAHYAHLNPLKLIDPDGREPGSPPHNVLLFDPGRTTPGPNAWEQFSAERANRPPVLKPEPPPKWVRRSIPAIIGALAVYALASEDDDGDVYFTYTRLNERTGKVYSGRSSGNITSSEGLLGAAQRRLNREDHQSLTESGYGPMIVDKVTEVYPEVRGREQMLIDFFGGAQSVGGTSGNKINGIADFNPNRPRYMNSSRLRWGPLPDNSPPRLRLD